MNARPEPLCDPDALVELVRSGDVAALDRLTRCYGEQLMAVGRRYCADAERARDAVQDALLAAGEHLTDFRGTGTVEGWLVRMVINACRRGQRGRKNDPRRHAPLDAAAGAAAPGASPEDAVLRRQIAAALGDALTTLPPQDRALLLLADGEGWKGPEVAEALGLSHAAVRARLSRARRRLRDALEPVWSEVGQGSSND